MHEMINDMKCNYLLDPICIDAAEPVWFSWKYAPDGGLRSQTAYRIVVSEENGQDVWDSGKVESGISVAIEYKGAPLKFSQRYVWKVNAWNESGSETGFSKPSRFETALPDADGWNASWINRTLNGTDERRSVAAPLLRKTFTAGKNIASARLYLCGVGYHELHINGSKFGDEVLAPAFTSYDKTLLYNTYDVTKALKAGKNAVGVVLGNGWYNCFTTDAWSFSHAPWLHHPKMILRLDINYADGTVQTIVSDKSWKAAAGPTIFDGLRNGEFYDARKEIDGWAGADFDDSEWSEANIVRSPGGKLKPAMHTPIKVTHDFPAIGCKEVQPGVWVFDIGQNISGWAKIKAKGPADTEITLKYAEKIKENGELDSSNINIFVKVGEFQTDKYIKKSDRPEVWEPRFTYHGFRYVQVTGLTEAPDLDMITGRFVHTALERRGDFKCSNPLLTRIQELSGWSTLGNYHGMPTDCPHREKNGWTGDASLSAEQVLLNFDPISAYRKWMLDFADVQRPTGEVPGIVPTGGWGYNWGNGPAWDSAMILIPWYMYVYTGDTSAMKSIYPNMKRYIDFALSMADHQNGRYIIDFGLGDWCPPNRKPDKPKCQVAITDTAYFYVETMTVAKCAAILGHDSDARELEALGAKIRESFRKEFVDKGAGIKVGNNQTSLSCAVYQGLVNDDESDAFGKLLIEEIKATDSHIDCGILGAKYIMQCLCDLNLSEYAYDIAAQNTFPSWGWWVEQGATTLWETWNGDSSLNHHMFSDVSAWFYKCLAGINPDPAEPGFKHIIFTPNPVRDLKWVKCSHDSMYGTIGSDWKLDDSGKLTMELTVPANTHATLTVPSGFKSEAGENTVFAHDKFGRELINIRPGKYKITASK